MAGESCFRLRSSRLSCCLSIERQRARERQSERERERERESERERASEREREREGGGVFSPQRKRRNSAQPCLSRCDAAGSPDADAQRHQAQREIERERAQAKEKKKSRIPWMAICTRSSDFRVTGLAEKA
jgi:hypothetical protein